MVINEGKSSVYYQDVKCQACKELSHYGEIINLKTAELNLTDRVLPLYVKVCPRCYKVIITLRDLGRLNK